MGERQIVQINIEPRLAMLGDLWRGRPLHESGEDDRPDAATHGDAALATRQFRRTRKKRLGFPSVE
jgi:hypothetical protein